MRTYFLRIPDLIVLIICFHAAGIAQTTFTRITDPTNPIVNDPPPPGYPGCTWVDYDNDGKLDLSMTGPAPNYLYRNLGNGGFQRITTRIGETQPIPAGSGGGHSWADYDNDGDLDVCVTGTKTILYRNDGGGNFAPVFSGALADTMGNRGWACAWGDYDQDGDVDLIVVHPANFFPPGSTPNVFLRNGGPPSFIFTKDDTSAIVSQGNQAYTVGSFVDYDLDNDLDFFIASGPVNVTGGVDFMYRNMKTETGVAFYRRITEQPFATDLADGQTWNWIDIDNDGDLDGFRTNYGFSGPGSLKQNHLYRNDGGVFSRVTSGAIVNDQLVSLANVWGDFDNDGDLDCFVTNEGPAVNSWYQNNGNGTFTTVTSGDPITSSANHRAASLGDFDNDGDLDLMVAGPGTAARGLYRNDLPAGRAWVNILCKGATSDRAAIGTKVKAKATINGISVWQIREVSSQNSFNGANMLNVHFGLGNATVIDSLVVTWPRGLRQVFTGVVPARFYSLTEAGGLTPLTDVNGSDPSRPQSFQLEQNYPNPFNPSTEIRYRIPEGGHVTLKVLDLLGREVATLVDERQEAGEKRFNFDARNLASGVYLYQLTAGEFLGVRKMIVLR